MIIISSNKQWCFLFSLTLVFFSCEESMKISNEDNIPPQAIILYPADGESISGEVVIQARATDNQEISHVEFYINQNRSYRSLYKKYRLCKL